MIEKLRLCFCVFLVMILPLSCVPLSGLADDLCSPEGFQYSIENLDYPDMRPYVRIFGYAGEAADVAIPSQLDGVPVENVHLFDSLIDGPCPERLVIPEGVKVVGTLFGENSENLTELVLPGTLKVLGGGSHIGVLAHAASLTTLTVPYSVSLICENAFHENTTLRVEAGSYAARWAKANGQPHEIIEHAPSVGDYDADGLTTTTDARLLLQAVANKVTLSPAQAAVADVDGDSETTATDARLILQRVAGKAEVDTLTCPLTFDSPLIPREAADTVEADIVGYNENHLGPSPGLPPRYYYIREPGPLKNPTKMVDHINESVAQSYHARYVAAIKGPTTGASVTMSVDGVWLGVNYRLSYYGVSLSVSLGSTARAIIME